MLKIHTFAFLIFLVCSTLAFALAKIDLNSASLEQLKALPGIGEVTAESIVAARPFHSKSELKNVKGIGDAKYKKLSKFVTVEEETAEESSPSEETKAMNAANEGAKSAADSAAGAAKSAASSAKSAMGSAAATATTAAKAPKKHLAPGETINVNTASAEDLARLPGIGKHKAAAIIQGRPFSSPEDLMRVKGIKSKTFAKIKDNITTE